MNGKFFGVSVGPGDPDLMTFGSVKKIKQADIIALPLKNIEDLEKCLAYTIARQAVPEINEKTLVAIDMPMTKDKNILAAAHDKGSKTLMEYLNQGLDVAFLTIGDISIYASAMYIHDLIMAAGYETELVSGVPSFCAAAGRLKISLAKQNKPLHIFPATYGDLGLDLDGTKILMKPSKSLELSNVENIYCVENCGLKNEKIYKGKEAIETEKGYFSLYIIDSDK